MVRERWVEGGKEKLGCRREGASGSEKKRERTDSTQNQD